MIKQSAPITIRTGNIPLCVAISVLSAFTVPLVLIALTAIVVVTSAL